VTHTMCPIKGYQHNHYLRHIATVVQDGSGEEAKWLECPLGNYRWFVLKDTFKDTPNMRFKKPRYGWKR
jgi:hypothetical protein